MAGRKSSLDIRITVSHMALLAGLVVGLVIVAYYLGLVAGRAVGFESALSGSAAQLAKLPVNMGALSAKAIDDEIDATAKDVYAKLRADQVVPPRVEGDNESGDGLRLAPPAIESSTDLAEVPPGGDAAGVDTAEPEVAAVRALSDDSNSKQQATGELGQEQKRVISAPAAAQVKVIGARSEVQDSGSGQESPVKVGTERSSTELRARVASSRVVEEDRATAVVDGGLSGTGVSEQPSAEKPSPAKQAADKIAADKVAAKLAADKAKADSLRAQETQPTAIRAGFYAQVASSPSQKDALNQVTRLRSAGFPAVVERSGSGKKTQYRVLVGPESSEVTAGRLVQQLAREKSVKSKPFVRSIR